MLLDTCFEPKHNNLKLAELHVHVGSGVAPSILWGMAHDQGIKLPTKDYWSFVKMITCSKRKGKTFEEYLEILHKITEVVQSSPYAIKRSVYEIIGGAYRVNNITLIELRFNPMKRNRGGERDLDHIILAALRGMDKALLEYPQVKAGLIFCLDRQFSYRKNKILAEKAIKYRKRGVVGLDFANAKKNSFDFSKYKDLILKCKNKGLRITVHTGENDNTNDIEEAIFYLEPERIGHGIKAAYNPFLLKTIRQKGIVLEICPTSNLTTGAVEGVKELKFILQKFKSEGVKFCLNTDGPEVFQTNLKKEIDLLLKNKILEEKDILKANRIAFESSFIPKRCQNGYF